LHVHLQQQEKRIRRVASKAVSMFPEYEEDMAQELRLRAIRAWETWDKEKGPLSAHTWRYIVGSHLKLIRRTRISARLPWDWRSTSPRPTAWVLP